MSSRACLLRVEELEQRAVPARFFADGHLVGCHAIRETITTGLNSATSASGNVPSGLLHGKVALSNVTTSQSFLKENFGGTLTITTARGTVTIRASGDVSLLSGSVNGTGTVTGGTGAFRGATGDLAFSGTADLLSQTLHGVLTGTICGPGAHKAHARRP
jgi:hypothetical protein